MSGMGRAFAARLFARVAATEFGKLRRSGITWITFVVYAFMIGVASFFMWMMRNPGMAESLGLMGQKAQMAIGGESISWETFLSLVLEMAGLAGMMLASVILTYLFGREYAEGTAKNMMALPVPRWMFVAAKLLVGAVWFAALSAWAILLAWIGGSAVGLGALPSGLFAQVARMIGVAALMGFACSAWAAWVAVESRGYLAPLGFAIFSMLLAVIFGATEWGRWVPWSILLWYSGAAGPGKELVAGSYVVVGAFFVIGAALILRHEVKADNMQ